MTLLARPAFRVALVALGVRLLLVGYAAHRFPPADDGTFYHVIAERIARGLGYTWAWPDGTVTIAANYPVGYPLLLAPFYALFGPQPVVAMLVNAGLGAVAAAAVHALASRVATPRGALFAGLVAALEPALVAYTPALMTEAVAGDLLVVAAAVATGERPRLSLRALSTGLLFGAATLMRPELLLLAPFGGALLLYREPNLRRMVLAALGVLAVALAVCLPWTLRNCQRLDRCAFVSANGGWNLLIGTSSLGRGGWAPLERIGVPLECRAVFGEGAKDRCFGEAALRRIRAEPLAWLALVPQKLGVTFDYGTAAAHYLGASNPGLVGEREKTLIGALELVGQRVVLVLAALGLARVPGPRARLRRRLALACSVAFLLPFAWVGFLMLVLLGALFGRDLVRWPPAWFACAAVLATALTHAVFFGAGRYALVCLPALTALSGMLWPAARDSTDLTA